MENNVKNQNTQKKMLIPVGIFLFFALILFGLGYKYTGGLSVGKNGYLALTLPLPETYVFIDQSKKIVTEKENEYLEVSLSPKNHTIIVSHENFYPWKKEIKIKDGEKLNLSPIFVYQNPSGSIITKEDPEYSKIIENIRNNLPPQKNSPKKSKDGIVSLWLEDNKIMIDNNGKKEEVIKPEDSVKNLDFYKNRNDVVIFSAGNGVYVVETNRDGIQNFMPIYKGENPVFFSDNENYIFIQDFQNLMQVII